MSKSLLQRAIKITLIFGIVFFLLNYFSVKNPDFSSLLGRSVLAAVVFFVIYIVLFTLLSSPERKVRFGTTIPIAVLLGIIIGALFFTIKIGIIIGLIVGVIAGFVWEFIARN